MSDENNNSHIKNEGLTPNNYQKNIKGKSISSNTLEYYNDDMSRNAVNGIFKDIDRINYQGIGSSVDTTSDFSLNNSRFKIDIDDFTENVLNETNSEYDYSLFRRGESKEPKIQKSIRYAKGINYNYESKDKLSMAHNKTNNTVEDIDNNDLFSNIKGQGVAKAPVKTNRYFENFKGNSNRVEKEPLPIFKVAFISCLSILILTTVSFIYVVAGQNSKISELLSINEENDRLTRVIEDLEFKIEEYAILINEFNERDNSTESSQIDNDEDNIKIEPGDANNEYVVKAGDNIARISQQFYGSQQQADYQKIIDANNLTSTDLRIGQILIIP